MGWKGDPDAFHQEVDGEVAGLTEKATPVDADLVFINDSADSNSVKSVQIGNLPGVSDLDDLDDVSAAAPSTGALLYFDGTDWVPAADGLTTKGDLYVFDGTDFKRLAVGSDDQVLKADSAQALGVKWAADETGDGGGGSGDPVNTIQTVDTAPGTPDAMDDEFDNDSFDTSLWTDINLGTVTKAERDHAFVLETSGSHGGQLRGVQQSAPVGDFTIRAKLLRPADIGTVDHVLFVAKGTSDRVYSIGWRANRLQAAQRSAVTSGAAAWGRNDTIEYPNFVYVEVDWDDTAETLEMRWSFDGTAWSSDWTGSLEANWTPGIVGLGIENNTARGFDFAFDWFRRFA